MATWARTMLPKLCKPLVLSLQFVELVFVELVFVEKQLFEMVFIKKY